MPAVRVTARGASRVEDGHCWIVRADVEHTDLGSEEVRVLAPRGRTIASAFFAPPPAPIALRIYARGAEHVRFTDDLLAARLGQAIARRGHDEPVCRLVHGEADRLPGLFVDRYGDAAVIQSGTAAMDHREEAAARLLASRFGIKLVVGRNDGALRDHEALPRRKGVLAGIGSTLVRVREGAAVLELDLLEDAKTGSFLDQRENHARAAEVAHGKALDAFTYHGGFALALARRAESVLALDQDARAVERARRNAELSGLGNVEVRTADAFETLRDLERSGSVFDVVVLDPPALAKRRGALTAALRDYQELNLRALRLVAPEGWLVTCSCSGKVTPALFGETIAKAARAAHRTVTIVERRGAGRDHPVLLGVPETEYLKCWFLRVLPS